MIFLTIGSSVFLTPLLSNIPMPVCIFFHFLVFDFRIRNFTCCYLFRFCLACFCTWVLHHWKAFNSLIASSSCLCLSNTNPITYFCDRWEPMKHTCRKIPDTFDRLISIHSDSIRIQIECKFTILYNFGFPSPNVACRFHWSVFTSLRWFNLHVLSFYGWSSHTFTHRYYSLWCWLSW